MYEPKDMFNRDIKPGDYITYGVKNSNDIHQVVAKVLEVIDTNNNYRRHRYQLRVYSYTNRSSWEDLPNTYNTTLYSNDTIIRVNESSLSLIPILNILLHT